jgi:hypothetical protein
VAALLSENSMWFDPAIPFRSMTKSAAPALLRTQNSTVMKALFVFPQPANDSNSAAITMTENISFSGHGLFC